MFFKLSIFFIALLALFIGLIEAQEVVPGTDPGIPEFQCTVGEDGWCRFNINLLKEQRKFQPSASVPNDQVKQVIFDASTIPVFGSDICETFPNVEGIWLENVEIEEFTVDALKECKKLNWFRLVRNPLTDLPRDIFKYNLKLKIVYIEQSPIKEIKEEWFIHLTELEQVSVAGTNIEYFPLEILRNAADLTRLLMYSNNLIDIDVKLILQQFPILNEVLYRNNLISCSRLQQINDAFRAREVYINTAGDLKVRSYSMGDVDGLDCVQDASWIEMVLDNYLRPPKPVIPKEEACQEKYKTLSEQLLQMKSRQILIRSLLNEVKCP